MYPLEKLDQLVNYTTHPQNCLNGDLSLKEFVATLSLAEQEAENIRKHLVSSLFAAKEKKELKVFVRTCQAVCVNLSDSVNDCIEALPAIKCSSHTHLNMVNIYKSILLHLDNLLLFIEQNFETYFNIRQKLPRHYAEIAKGEFSKRLDRIVRHLIHECEHHELISLAASPVNHFIDAPLWEGTDYGQLNYTKEYLDGLENILMEKPGDIPRCLEEFIIYMNVNCPLAVTYFMKKMEAASQKADGLVEQVDEWITIQKEVKRSPEREELGFITAHPSLKQLLLMAIAAEITFLEKKIKRLDTQATAITKSTGDTVLNTPLTVAQLAVFMRLIVDTGIIKCDNQLMLLKIVARSFQTPKKTHISADSLRTKFYTAEAPAVDAMKDYLIRMMNHLRQYKQ